jgi:hypothetical protein
MKRKVRICEGSWLAKLAARKLGYDKVAIVFGHTIHLHNTTVADFLARPQWVRHELKHVEQYERLGFLRFLVRYVIEHLRNGYRNNAFEVEARAAEKDPSISKHYDLSAYREFMGDL